MRYFLVGVACLLLAIPATAQTILDGGSPCLKLDEKAGQSLEASWASSFSVFLGTYQAELSAEQRLLIREAIELGSSRALKIDRWTSVQAMKGLMIDVREALPADQFSELLARMGSESQQVLSGIGVIGEEEIACACKSGASSGCPSGFDCKVGCTTWGTGEWNGLCKRGATQIE